MRKHLYVILIFVGAAMSAGAQTAHLRITNLINFPDTAYEGVVYPVQFILKNVGTGAYQGPFQVILQADSGSEILYFNQNPSFVLFPNDTVVLSGGNGVMGYQFTSQVYKAGNDVVVVWPYSTQMSVGIDTLVTGVYYIPSGIISNGPDQVKTTMKVFPNPFKDIIHLETGDGSMVEKVRISDLFGREIYRKETAIDRINLPGLKNGMYILELEISDNRKVVMKMFRQ